MEGLKEYEKEKLKNNFIEIIMNTNEDINYDIANKIADKYLKYENFSGPHPFGNEETKWLVNHILENIDFSKI